MSGTDPDFLLDLAREARIGLPEAIFCAGKTPPQIAAIVEAAGRPLLLTRLDAAFTSRHGPPSPSTGGQAALHAILASCAPGVAVVNIDNGYGAACAALRIERQLAPARLSPEGT